MIEPVLRTKILFDIQEQKFNETSYGNALIKHLVLYQERVEQYGVIDPKIIELYDLNRVDYEYIQFTINWSAILLQQVEPNSMESLFCEFYNNQFGSTFSKIKTSSVDNTFIRYLYDQELRETLHLADTGFSLISGFWMPRGRNEILGNHPVAGISGGIKKNEWIGDITFIFRFLEAKNSFSIIDNGTLRNTKDFFGIYLGIDGGYELFRNMKHEFDVLVGLGYDGIESAKSLDDDEPIYINSFNYNVGVGYKFYVKKYNINHLGVQLKYNFINYDTKGGSKLSGNSISLRILYRIDYDNNAKGKKLKTLHYDYNYLLAK